MQQQDALAARLDPVDGTSRDFLVVDVGPVVGGEINAPGHVVVRGQVLLNRVLPEQAGNAKEWSDSFRVAEREAQGGKAVLDLLRSLIHRHLVEGEGMVLAVV